MIQFPDFHFGKIENTEETTRYLLNQYKKISFSISKQTIQSWFNGDRRLKKDAKSGKLMFGLCFALQLTEEVDFFLFRLF